MERVGILLKYVTALLSVTIVADLFFKGAILERWFATAALLNSCLILVWIGLTQVKVSKK